MLDPRPLSGNRPGEASRTQGASPHTTIVPRGTLSFVLPHYLSQAIKRSGHVSALATHQRKERSCSLVARGEILVAPGRSKSPARLRRFGGEPDRVFDQERCALWQRTESRRARLCSVSAVRPCPLPAPFSRPSKQNSLRRARPVRPLSGASEIGSRKLSRRNSVWNVPRVTSFVGADPARL